MDENDAAIVALRASHETVDLHCVETRLPGEVAYPMLARGRLVGALVLGTKANGETYAPDESAAIAQVAQSVGVALDLLGATTGGQIELLEALTTLAALTRSTNDAVRELPAAIEDRVLGHLGRPTEPADVRDQAP